MAEGRRASKVLPSSGTFSGAKGTVFEFGQLSNHGRSARSPIRWVILESAFAKFDPNPLATAQWRRFIAPGCMMRAQGGPQGAASGIRPAVEANLQLIAQLAAVAEAANPAALPAASRNLLVPCSR